jgi:hypothetical protein
MRPALIFMAALLLAGCGAEDTADQVREAIDPVAEAADKTAATGGARVDGDMRVRVEGVTIRMTMDGAVSFEDQEASLVMDYAEGGIPGATAKDMERVRREAGFPIRVIQRPDEVYVSTRQIVEHGRADGVKWIKIDIEEIDEEGNLDLAGFQQMSETNPEAMLRFLKTVADARETGRGTIDGVKATRYTATVDIRDYPETVEPERREAAERTVEMLTKAWGSPTHRVHVWIDDDGLIRREQMTYSFVDAGERAHASIVLDFLDAGQPQEIDVPDDDEVVDMSDAVAEQLRKG